MDTQLLPAFIQSDETLQLAVAQLVALLAVFAIGLGGLLFEHQRRQRIIRRKLDDQREKFGRELSLVRYEVECETRQRIARDLHDGGQYRLRSALAELGGVLADEQASHHQEVLRAAVLLEQHQEDLRSLSQRLEGEDLLPLGLHGSIRQEVTRIGRWPGLEVEARLPETDDSPFGRNEELFLFRIFQETVTNIRKHAGATRIAVTLAYSETHMMLSIADNGQGFDVVRHVGKTTGGMANLRNRAELLKATLAIRSDPDTGTSVELRLPVPERSP